jgi:hypothetical protein
VIGKMFGFRPEKLNHFVNQYVVGAEEWFIKKKEWESEKLARLVSKIELVE